MKSFLYFIIIVAAILCAIPLVPLGTAVNALQLKRAGLEVEHIEGNLWEGQMYGVKLGPIDLGDVQSKMSLEDLKSGRVRLDLTGSEETTAQLKGGFSFGWGGVGIDRFNLALPVMAGPPPIGGVTLILDDLTAKFPRGECADGRGEIRAYLNGALPTVGLPNEMSGPALCREGNLAFDLASRDGNAIEEVTILGVNKYKISLFIRPQNPRVTEVLQAKGFRPYLDGYRYTEERTLGGGVTPVLGDGAAGGSETETPTF
jgi:general secretion pathway protein N